MIDEGSGKADFGVTINTDFVYTNYGMKGTMSTKE